jgi:signal transduction histidine kinase
VTRRTRRLRTRLLVAMIAIALGTLVVTAAVTAGLARRTATDAARSTLAEHTPVVANELNQLIALLPAARTANNTAAGRRQIRRIRTLVQTTLSVSDGAVVAIDADGNVREFLGGLLGVDESAVTLPNGVSEDDLDIPALQAGDTQKGRDGDTVFQAEPLTKVNELTPVVVLADQVNSRPFGDSSGLVLGAAILALVVAALIAAYLARRMTRPLAAMEATAGRIAAGDLSARVETEHVADDELGSLAKAINAMAERLDASRGHERAFLLSVSHDLRTPLTSIRGYAEAILDGTVDDTEAQLRAAEVIVSESRRLERLVADLLDLARLDTHQFSLRPQPIDARNVVGEAVDAFRPAATDLGLALNMDGTTDPAPGFADPQRLAQIVANLVENALKYASTVVTVGVRTIGDRIEVRVDDDGPGIAPNDLPHVFERLYTSRTAPGRIVGTGIGLAIVHELAAAMGGDAHVEPIDAEGTRFVVTIPAGSLQPTL